MMEYCNSLLPSGRLPWVMVALWAGAIFVFSSMSNPLGPLSSSVFWEDIGRLAHLAEYAGLTVLVFGALSMGKAWLGRWTGPACLAIVLSFAFLDELRQSLVPGRTFDLFDVALDLAGACVALGAMYGGRGLSRSRLR
jgi:VanZ family protein